jgi:membrane associated rhomboid family serine protease
MFLILIFLVSLVPWWSKLPLIFSFACVSKAPASQPLPTHLLSSAVMQVDIPDPAYTGSPRSRANFRLALKIALGFVAAIWLIQLLSWAFGLELQQYGVRPRSASGLPGILFAPLLHNGFDHLIANTVPLLVLGTGMLYLYPNSSVTVLPAVYLVPGVMVWLFGRPSVHAGASGLIYGLVAYVFFAGVMQRDRRAIAAAMLVFFLYGGMAWGVLPVRPGMSWETHLAAALVGAALALALRDLDIPPRRRYSWEDEAQAADADGPRNDA